MPPRLQKSSLPSANIIPFPRAQILHCQCLDSIRSRFFSSSPPHETRQRRIMFRWLDGPGRGLKDPLPGSTNYLNAYGPNGNLIRASGKKREVENDDALLEDSVGKDDTQNIASGQAIPRETPDDLMPFPLNKHFRSEAVLSEELREEIYNRIIVKGSTVRLVSAELGVEMKRVGAVVRLKSVEKQWIEKGKPLAIPYGRAVTAMLPQTRFVPGETPYPHESINDLPVHRDTMTQIFHPVSESRHFTRVDAGKVFNPTLLPADDRIPHPELVVMEKERMENISEQGRISRQRGRLRMQEAEAAKKEKRKQERQARDITKVTPEGSRWEFRFEDISVESVGKGGRDRKGVGARYGIPHQDRKRGQIKIPRFVE